jgi:cytoskeletal protein CcmA (bactofilin family)
MFGKKNPSIRTLVGEGTVIDGELRFTDGLRIDGEVVGNVIASGGERSILVIGEKARITGKVKAGHVIVNGYVRGPVECLELLELQPKARIEGHVRYERLEMHQGATVHGEFRPLSAEEKPALKLATSSALPAPTTTTDTSQAAAASTPAQRAASATRSNP